MCTNVIGLIEGVLYDGIQKKIATWDTYGFMNFQKRKKKCLLFVVDSDLLWYLELEVSS